jgi:hypothetical protein
MHRRNQFRDLINADTILRDITPDDLGNQAEINHLRGAFLGHIFYPASFDWGYVVERSSFTISRA